MRSLTNLLAVRTADAGLRAELLARWSGHRDFATVTEVGHGWIVAEAPLPHSNPRHGSTNRGWLGFADGEENVTDREGFARELSTQPSNMHRYPGDIGAVLLDQDGATLMRSPSGLVPWFFHHGADGLVAVSTRFVWFVRHVAAGLTIDPFAHAIATDGISCIDTRTPLQGVSAVRVGSTCRVRFDGTAAQTRFWRPEEHLPVGRRRPDPVAYGQALRRILIHRLEADLHPNGGNLIGLSGGVDSSCLGALAVGPANRPLDAFTLLPGLGHPAHVEVDSFVQSIAAVVRPERHWRIHLTEDLSLACAADAPAVAMPVPHPALAYLGQMVAEGGIAQYTGGEAADDLFGGAFVLGKDWIEDIPVVQLVRSLRRPWYGVARRRVARDWWDAKRGVRELPLPVDDELSAVFRPEIAEEYADWLHTLRSGLRRSVHPWRHLLLFFEFDGWLRQNWEVCSELGVRRSLPFWCRETIELALAAHPREHALPPKRFIRLGLRADVPAANLDRVDKGAWSEEARVGWPGGSIPEQLSSMVRDELIGSAPAAMDFGDASVLVVLMASARATA